MARIARIVVPGLPHHVTQRGNHRATIFFGEGDYALYKRYLAEEAEGGRRGVGLLPDAEPCAPHPRAPRRGRPRPRHRRGPPRRYTAFVNARARQTGHLFQSRFASAAMDEAHLMAAFIYVALNPVRARLVARAEDWPWSSARTWLGLGDDGLTRLDAVAPVVPDFRDLLASPDDRPEFKILRKAELIGRPAGDAGFVAMLESRLDRGLKQGKRGRPRKSVTGTDFPASPTVASE